jgi:transcriptional regulator with XRE-family HTH domain
MNPRKNDTPTTRMRRPGPGDIEVGRRIRARRLECGMSQTELATQIGLTFQQVQKYEKGVNRVGAGRIQQIADALSVPAAYFFGVSERTKREDNDLTELLKTAHAVRLVRAFGRFRSPRAKRALAELVEAIADED